MRDYTGEDAHIHIQQWFSAYVLTGFAFCNIRTFEGKCRGHSETLKTELEVDTV